MTHKSLTEISKCLNESISLRKPNEQKVAEYAERMRAGVIFPPIVIGEWPRSEKYSDTGVVDGLHRLAAAYQAELKTFPVEIKKFTTIEEALLYMYEANQAHGLPVTEGQRNARMKLIRQIDPKLTMEKIAKMFSLSIASVDRIIKGKQGEGKSGPKGANASKGQQSQKALTPKAFCSILQRLDSTLKKVKGMADIAEYLAPMGEDDEQVPDEKKIALLLKVIHHLSSLAKEIDSEVA